MAYVIDSLRSLIGNLGNPERDKSASLHFAEQLIDVEQLSLAYRTSWVARKIVDIPASDALRKWRAWSVEDAVPIELEETRLGLRMKALEALIKARLFGGAAIYIGTDQDAAEPMDVDAIRPGGINHLTVFTRQSLVAGEIDQDPLSGTYGRPLYYTLSGGTGQARVHPSRLVIMRGDARPDDWLTSGTHDGWDESVLVATMDAVKQFIGTSANIASLVHEANVDVIGVPGLMQNLAQPKYEDTLLQRFGLAARGKGVNGTLLMDAEETYNRRNASFADLSPILETYALFAAASADIPSTRFLARSPTGLIATGGHDMANYHDKLQGMQELEIRPAMAIFDQCLIKSAGITDPDADYDWRPLEQMSDEELANIGKVVAESIEILSTMGLYSQEELRELSTHRLAEVGAFPHLESIATATLESLELDPLPEETAPTIEKEAEEPVA